MVIRDIYFLENIQKTGSLVVGVYEDGTLTPSAAKLDKNLNGEISKKVKKLAFKGKLSNSEAFAAENETFHKIILVGFGEQGKKFSNFEFEQLGAAILKASQCQDSEISVLLSQDDTNVVSNSFPALVAFGLMLKSWNFDKYKSKKDEKNKLKRVNFVVTDVETTQAAFNELKKLSDGIFLTREVVSEPANVIYPESLANTAMDELKALGVDVQILTKKDMTELDMGALLGVAQGSVNEPRLVVLHWHGNQNSNEKPIAVVGKGVTFDSGGISIKPDEGMYEMRYDMAGAGVVLGLLKAAALNKLPVNLVGIMALVENMPSGSAQRPGDIVKSMSGQTIEIMSTDAEGRLILADALWYVQEKYQPSTIIDLATLTGAIVVALGHEFAGLFSNNDTLADQIKASAEETGEKVWRMPLSKHFDESINSDIADMMNLSKPGTRAGGTTAAQFLKRFIKDSDTQWAHIDIAGVETTKDDLFMCSHGVTGFGVHLLYDFLKKTRCK